MNKPSQRAAYVLALVGIQPWKANEKEIALAEQLLQKYRYIESAADELKIILAGPNHAR